MKSAMLRFLLFFTPTCGIVIGAGCIGVYSRGFWSATGWIVTGTFGFIALIQLIVLLSGLSRINSWQTNAQQNLHELEERDAELFAQGKSFEEVMSQYKQPHP
jgi:hypothetical protein